MRIFTAVLTLSAVLGLAAPSFARGDLAESRPSATMVKKEKHKKVEVKKVEDADGAKHEEKVEKTEEVKPE